MWELEEARRLRPEAAGIAEGPLDFPDPFELGVLEVCAPSPVGCMLTFGVCLGGVSVEQSTPASVFTFRGFLPPLGMNQIVWSAVRGPPVERLVVVVVVVDAGR